jgi:hypothetical protein
MDNEIQVWWVGIECRQKQETVDEIFGTIDLVSLDGQQRESHRFPVRPDYWTLGPGRATHRRRARHRRRQARPGHDSAHARRGLVHARALTAAPSFDQYLDLCWTTAAGGIGARSWME